MKYFLYKIDDGTSNEILVTSDTEDENYIRLGMFYNDRGGMDCEIFNKVIITGTITKITSHTQVPNEWFDCIPYSVGDIEVDEYVIDLLSQMNADGSIIVE